MKWLALLFLLAACAPKPGDTPSPTPKGLQAEWSRPGDPNWSFYFPSSNEIMWTYGTGGKCQSDVTVQFPLDQNEGTFVVSNSIATETVPGMPDCTMFDGNWAYSVLADDSLILCQTGSQCLEFQ